MVMKKDDKRKTNQPASQKCSAHRQTGVSDLYPPNNRLLSEGTGRHAEGPDTFISQQAHGHTVTQVYERTDKEVRQACVAVTAALRLNQGTGEDKVTQWMKSESTD